MSKKRDKLPKSRPNRCRPSKVVRVTNRMAVNLSRGLNPLRWPGLVPKSVALMANNTNPVPYVHRRERNHESG